MTDRVLVSFDGVVRDPDLPLLHADDLGAVRGEGVRDDAAAKCSCAKVGLHLDRLADGARLLGLPPVDRAAAAQALDIATGEWVRLRGEDETMMVRLAYSRGRSRLQAMARPDM